MARGKPLVNFNVRISRSLWRRLRLECLQRECLERTFITEALVEYLRKRRLREG